MKKLILTLALFASTLAVSAQDCCQQPAGNAVIDNIMTRTSIRRFKQQPVESGKVDTLLRAAMAAPTAVNKQPWHFVVVDDAQVLNQLAGQGRRGDMLRNAPLAIVVCGDMSKAMEGKGQEYWIQDTSAATENLLLAAHAMGLGAVWTGQWPMEDRYPVTQQVLQLPQHIVPLCTVVIGYPDEQPAPKDKWKPENVSYNRFGGSR
ncbi:MAG: nitroreductase family protein [Prevotella sp.]|nr:nitroreductase family protein [Prevotella sp.]